MTVSDVTPETAFNRDAKPASIASALIDMQLDIATTFVRQQGETLRFLKERQEKDIEFLGRLAQAQDPVGFIGTLTDYWQGSLSDWMGHSAKTGAALGQSIKQETEEAAKTGERIGVLAGPAGPIPGAPLSAPQSPSFSQSENLASEPPRNPAAAKSRTNPV